MVKEALEAFLKTLDGVEDSAEAALAKSIAGTIDHDATSATAKAALAKTLVELLDRLRALAPLSGEQEDELERLRKRIPGSAAA